MMLSDVRDYIESFGISENVYMGKMDAKKDKSIGVYNSKHERSYKTAIGGDGLKSYDIKNISLLVHWNKSLRDTEQATTKLFDAVRKTREVTVNNETIKFIQPIYEIQDVGTDDSGIYEMVIEAAVIYEREEKD